MHDASFFAVFVGIESPDEETLNPMRKRQNTRRHIPESIKKIYGPGSSCTRASSSVSTPRRARSHGRWRSGDNC